MNEFRQVFRDSYDYYEKKKNLAESNRSLRNAVSGENRNSYSKQNKTNDSVNNGNT